MTGGLTAYLDLTTAEEHVFRKSDFCVIEAESQQRRLKDVMEYQKERRTFLR